MTEIETKKIKLADMLREARRRQADLAGLQSELTAIQKNASDLSDEIDKLEQQSLETPPADAGGSATESQSG